ncbi:MAG: hypothetical protein A2Y89_00100 [Chloroflexi bacterium RBG_13_51_18]|nr:MAG: hypothetical protein A2Y89_00100 [Chloroflexi bacterium RBG_13_51_18]
MSKDSKTQTKPPKKKGFPFGKIILLILVLFVLAAVLQYFRIPQKIGLIKSPADNLFTMTPDSEKAAVIMDNLQAAGLNTSGVEVYVLPVAGTDHNLAMIVLDASKGFTFGSYSGGDPVKDFLAVISQAQGDGINRAAITYYDEEGRQLVAATVPMDAINAYSQGNLTDNQLMEQVDVGTDDLWAFIGMIKDQLK